MTGNPELAVAVSVNVVPPTWVCGSGKVMVWMGSGANTVIVNVVGAGVEAA